MDCSQHVLRIQPQESPPIVERAFEGLIDTSQPIDTFRWVEEGCPSPSRWR